MSETSEQLLSQGLFHHRQGQVELAMQRYTEVLRVNPENADALYYIAVVACQEGQFKEGADLARRAISFGKKDARVFNLLGQALYRMGERLEAVQNFDHALALDENFADAHGNRANILADAGRPEEALKAFDRALALKPDSAADWLNRGAVLQGLGRLDAAIESYDRAIACVADFPEAYVNRGNALKELGHADVALGADAAAHFDAAEAAYAKAIAINPRFPEAHAARGLLRLLRGDWEAGFKDYEFRTDAGEPTYEPLDAPRWDGGMRPGTRLILVTEQGLGDAIQFCRLAPLIASRGLDVTILARKAMAPLLSTLSGVPVIVDRARLTADKRPLAWLPLLSLPGALGLTPQTAPAAVPYLAALPPRVAAWKRKQPAGFRIGVNWSSGHSSNPAFRRRDIPLVQFAALADIPGVQLIALQKGEATAQLADIAFRDRIMTPDADPEADADFFLDTAAIMENLDLVVTCDTSVAHLAGALARPVFTALPLVADWRWLLGREDTPWYPTMRLFRQGADRDWTPVFARIAEAVRGLAASQSPV
jgi:tetratricopeptide (TPR) repeat protein